MQMRFIMTENELKKSNEEYLQKHVDTKLKKEKDKLALKLKKDKEYHKKKGDEFGAKLQEMENMLDSCTNETNSELRSCLKYLDSSIRAEHVKTYRPFNSRRKMKLERYNDMKDEIDSIIHGSYSY